MPDLEQLAKKWADAFNKRDMSTLRAMYHPNVVNYQPHAPGVVFQGH